VLGALGRSAEAIYSDLDDDAQTAARQLFLRLVTLGEGTEDTRRRVLRDELESLTTVRGQWSAVIDVFGKARLLSFDRDPITRGATIEVAHEALLREWTRLREWLDESRADLRLERQLANAVREWQTAQEDVSFLMSGSRLEQFESWAANTTIALTQDERAFLAFSIAERHKVLEKEKQSVIRLRRLNRVVTTIGSIATILAVLAVLFGVQSNRNAILAQEERDRADESAKISFSRELAAAAINNLDEDPERSILLALQAIDKTYSENGTVLPEAEEALHNAVQASRIELTLSGHTDAVWLVTYSSDGKLLASTSFDNTAKVWNANTGKELFTLRLSDNSSINGVSFSPDVKWLATANGDNTVRLWDVSNGTEVMKFLGHTDSVQFVSFSMDGSMLVSSASDGTTRIWDARSGKELQVFSEEVGVETFWASFNPDGTLVVTANTDFAEGWATVWNLKTGEKVFTLPSNATVVRCAIFSPDGSTIVTTGDDQTAKLWNAATGEKILTFNGHTNTVSGAAFSSDGTRLVTSGHDRHAKIWDVATGKELFDISGHNRDITSVSFSPDGQHIATASVDTQIKIWNATPNRELLTLVNGPAISFSEGAELAYSPDGKYLVTANSDLAPNVWEIDTQKLLFNLIGHTDAVTFATYSSDGTRIATASNDGTAKIWDASNGKELLSLKGHTDFVFGAAFSPDGKQLATTSFDYTVNIWDTQNGRLITTLAADKGWGFSVAFSPDGKQLATSSIDPTALVWNLDTGNPTLMLSGHKDLVNQVTFSPDGKKIATASFDGTAKVWDSLTGQELFSLTSHSAAVFDITFSWDGKLIATASADKTAKVWNSETGKEMLTLNAPGSLSGVAFSPDNRKLAVAGHDGTTRIYLLRIEDLIALANTRVTRTLTLEECQQYLHVDACPAFP
ncbi:MAG TPA: WD40 repeat domain-containing protein, partial [Anaerolineales bacterium]|nr:WD40 repeat domain-containing protein [Anaerolineales bacterium]